MQSKKRRGAMSTKKRIAASIASAAAIAGNFRADAVESKPNIIIFLADDQGFGQLPVYHEMVSEEALHRSIITERYDCDPLKAKEAAAQSMPNLQRLAENGVVFMSAFVTSPMCGPSRAALMTGRYQQRFGSYYNPDTSQHGVPASETMLPAFLKEAGYRTALVGKWHLGRHIWNRLPEQTRESYANVTVDCVREDHPMSRGFDYFFGYYASGTTYYDSPGLFRRYEHVKAEGFLPEQLTDEALGFIDSCAGNPFFLYFSHPAPHTPLEKSAPEKYQQFDTGNPEVDNYYAYVASLDESVRRVVEKLSETGQLENTLIFYLSDNGAVVDSPRPLNGPRSGYKGLSRLGGTHVPMIIHWPERFAPAVFSNAVMSIDILPTALAAAGMAMPKNIDGADLIPHIAAGTKVHETLFWAGPEVPFWSEEMLDYWKVRWEYTVGRRDDPAPEDPQKREGRAGWAVLQNPWLLRCNPVEDLYELYNIAEDLSEQKNLARFHPDILLKLKSAYLTWAEGLAAPMAWSREQYDLLIKEVPGKRSCP